MDYRIDIDLNNLPEEELNDPTMRREYIAEIIGEHIPWKLHIRTAMIDEGIGKYEYHGVKETHHDYQFRMEIDTVKVRVPRTDDQFHKDMAELSVFVSGEDDNGRYTCKIGFSDQNNPFLFEAYIKSYEQV